MTVNFNDILPLFYLNQKRSLMNLEFHHFFSLKKNVEIHNNKQSNEQM
jgi:hypothetical protein